MLETYAKLRDPSILFFRTMKYLLLSLVLMSVGLSNPQQRGQRKINDLTEGSADSQYDENQEVLEIVAELNNPELKPLEHVFYLDLSEDAVNAANKESEETTEPSTVRKLEELNTDACLTSKTQFMWLLKS